MKRKIDAGGLAMVWLLRFVLLFIIIFLLSYVVKSLFTSKRKLETARKHKQFLLIDNEDVRKNFLLTYKGAVFTGEKYMGPADNTFDVVTIFIWPENAVSLKGLVKDDFFYINKKILECYPNAEIFWKSPVKEFLQE
ncbi:MAG: sigma-w pathway protein ysdB [Bacillus sp. (in: firmicutes)]